MAFPVRIQVTISSVSFSFRMVRFKMVLELIDLGLREM